RVCGGDGVDEDVDGVTETAGGDECVIGGWMPTAEVGGRNGWPENVRRRRECWRLKFL
ncbi:hypothetical protein Tco_0147155, partial [Tanacetum coccineum]